MTKLALVGAVGLVALAASTLDAATVQVDLVPCILAPEDIVSFLVAVAFCLCYMYILTSVTDLPCSIGTKLR